eukprot:TRINITY_DN24375_c0_g1_i2.p1 TRINITY_DN24375_c0_g1~~TRINITY_DN24375_c0_g1_i2.p1  ORF type:complete len:301 (+),score=12.54 TRINITY_DN24375_c0_g1_i2:79-903(+)
MESPFLSNNVPSVLNTDSFKCNFSEEREDGLSKAISKHISWKGTNSSLYQDFDKSRQELISQSQFNFLNNAVMEQMVAIQLLIKELESKECNGQSMGDRDLAKAVYQKVSKGGRYITFKQFTAAVCLLDVYKKMTVDQILAHQKEDAPYRQEKFQMLANKTKMVGRSVRNFFTSSYTILSSPDSKSQTELTPYISAPMSTTEELRGDISNPQSPSGEHHRYASLPNNIWSSVIKGGNKLSKGITKMSRNLSITSSSSGKKHTRGNDRKYTRWTK